MMYLKETVFPSDKKTIEVNVDDTYDGAHFYKIQNCLGFSSGATHYADTFQVLQFVEKNDDDTIIAGVQSEQLAIILLDRCKKLNTRFPSEHNQKQMKGLEMFLEGCKDRIEERMQRGVMGDLKK